MKRLCYASLLKVLYHCKPYNVSQCLINGTMLLILDDYEDLTGDDNAASRMATGHRNVSPEAGAEARNVKVSSVIDYFRDNVISLLNKAKIKTAILALRDILADDDSIPGDTPIYLESLKTKDEIINETVFDPAELIANIFLYTVANVKSTDLKTEIKEVTEEYLNSFDSKKDTISFMKNIATSTTSIKKTIKDKNFNGIFNEVKHLEALGLKNNNELRVFHLNVINNKFSSRDLKKFLVSNVGMYVFSRAEIEQFKIEDDVESIGLQALNRLKKYGGANYLTGDTLGDMILYAFLEQVLNAPKIMSKIELATTASRYGSKSDGIHLLTIDEGLGQPYHQLVFGASQIIGDLTSAVDKSMEAVKDINDDPSTELNVVESTLFGRVFDDSTAEYMKNIILPSRGGASAVDQAYGIFLGYTLGLDSSTLSNSQFRVEAVNKMKEDIKSTAPYIVDKINSMGMNGYSFYFYVLPFNDAPNEKKCIISDLLAGGVC
ncbi:HamA C-terminal domain-containing protein [Haloimpatiens lingqiaonensis]|uniref:HamA C-terminal domain-containing protein n=1 Tax=Haloimpatiens lingqiaonensis TaxID=1380675 RepID=UPI0010FCFA87|nr:Hachiman antiphage defense system protein HamA [Haloimpatiens lingqiaonensis]